ncbi:hypothetical protein BCR34DRAFT_176545 [Clohesyomyces aquaticus]|uniref:Uncharacterized protein n=1 Tax=Clohesyomyces aquaticus TaxID=1231657 RepID=A0A1Y1YFR5_9PLEO|nr:hypothetical protein BCR34DRAFT_176545 [Clohesyomyces aquaticus]
MRSVAAKEEELARHAKPKQRLCLYLPTKHPPRFFLALQNTHLLSAHGEVPPAQILLPLRPENRYVLHRSVSRCPRPPCFPRLKSPKQFQIQSPARVKCVTGASTKSMLLIICFLLNSKRANYELKGEAREEQDGALAQNHTNARRRRRRRRRRRMGRRRRRGR